MFSYQGSCRFLSSDNFNSLSNPFRFVKNFFCFPPPGCSASASPAELSAVCHCAFSSATGAILSPLEAIVNVFSVFYLFQTIQTIFTFYIIFATLIYRLFQYYSDYFQVLLYIPSLLAGENVCYPSHCYHDYRFPDNPLSERKIRIFPVSPRYLFYHHCPFFRICIS